MKSFFSLVSSIIITVLLFIRLINATSFEEIMVIGFLTVLCCFFTFYLLFEKRIKSKILFSKRLSKKHDHISYYIVLIVIMILIEILFIFNPLNNYIFEILKRILMAFFFAGIIILSIRVYYEKRM
jgi:hypothetical protein